MKRTLATLLCAALTAGLLPDPALAQFRSAAARPVAAPLAAPAVVVPGAVFSAPLSPAPTLPSGPSLSLPAAPSLKAAAPTAAAARAEAPAAALQSPVAQAAFAAVPLRTPAPAVAVAAVAAADPAARNAPLAASRSAAPFARLSNPAALETAGRLFDGAAARGDAANAVRMPAGLSRLWNRPRLAKPAPVDTAFTPDAFGGPKALSAAGGESRLGRLARRAGRDAAYGAKWAVTLFGLSSLLQVALSPLASLPWAAWIPHGMLGTFGRVELLTDFGPAAVAELAVSAPLAFFGLALPQAVLMEELTYRLLNFGITFGLLAAVRPAANALSAFLDKVPDLFGMRSGLQWVLRQTAKVSGKAFAIAASLSAFSFAAAHFAAWGVNPVTLAVHLALGLGLAWTAYRSRGLTAPVTAHLGYNLLSIGAGVLVPALLMAQMASLTAITLGIVAAAFAWYQWRAWKRDAAAAADAARGVTRAAPTAWQRAKRWFVALMVPALLVSSFAALTPRYSEPVAVPPAAAAPAAPAAPADADKAMLEHIAKMMGVPVESLSAAHGAAASAAKPVLNAEQMVQRNKPAVVMVRTPNGMGTGFIVSKDGLLVTNAHVVSQGGHAEDPLATNFTPFVKIRFANGREVPAKVVGFHSAKDLALVQLPANPFGWPTVTLGDSKSLAEGQEVVAMGYPRALPFTVTRGIVSGLEFRNNGFVSYIQHDASVNPGNSGGPLFNRHGEVVGVNSMIMTQSGGFDGISYAITAADVQKALDQYAKVGNISAAWLGAVFERTGGASAMGLSVDAVRAESPAAKAGVRHGDVVIGIDGHSVAGDAEGALKALTMVLRSKIPTQPVELQLYRAGGVVTVTVSLGAK